MPKILVIDNDATLRGELVDWLGGDGFDVLTAEDGVVGVKYAYDHIPSLIVCDLSVPQLDGYGVFLEIRANPATANTPIIFLSTGEQETKPHPKLRLGADDFITKPFTQQDLLKAVQTRLQKNAREQDELQQQIVQLEMALAVEEEQRLVKAKMVAMVAHDFRNPLATILSSNNLLRDYADRMDADRRLDHMNRIDASVRNLISMLDEMLLLAQIDCGSLVFSPEPLNVGLFLQQLVEAFQLINIDSHRILFDNRFATTLWVDPRLLQQIASNLISNAIKYSPSGGVVQVTLDNTGAHIVLTVHDQGIGISEADQLSLFEAFQRGSNVGNIPGTGLGLTIVKQAVELHLGEIQIESQIGSGTTMIVTLPATEVTTTLQPQASGEQSPHSP